MSPLIYVDAYSGYKANERPIPSDLRTEREASASHSGWTSHTRR